MQSQVRGAGGPPSEISQAAAGVGGAVQSPANSFSNVLKQGLDQVNQTQQRASDLATTVRARRAGRRAAAGHARDAEGQCSFRAITEVRNRFVNAYQEIMNMPI